MANGVLVLEPSSSRRMLLCSLLAASQYDVLKADCAQDAARQARAASVDIILAGASDRDPSAVVGEIRRAGLIDSGTKTPPVLLFDRGATPVRRLRALAAGARDMLTDPIPDGLLLARLRGVLREAHAAREARRRSEAATSFGFAETAADFSATGRIAVVSMAHGRGSVPERLSASFKRDLDMLRPEDALTETETTQGAAAYVLDCDGLHRNRMLDLLPELRSRAHSRHAAVLVLHQEEDTGAAISALDSGASDIAEANSLGEELALRIRAMLTRKAAEDALRETSETSLRLAATDPLTGLFNRRYAQAYLSKAIETSKSTNRPFTLMMLDIDHFKKINDSYGHTAGDAVLSEVARRLRENLRAIDLVARFGGEEFLVVMPGTETERAVTAADRLRGKIGSRPVALEDGRDVMVTVSIGVTVGGDGDDLMALAQKPTPAQETRTVSRLISAADTALYSAKLAGRNRVELSVSPA